MSIRSVLFFASYFFISILCGQTHYSRVRIDLKQHKIEDITKLGLDLDHVNYVQGRFVDLEIHQEDIDKLESKGIKYNVLIQDLETYYSDEQRPSELSLLENRSIECNQKACNTINYITPTNFSLGSMGGYYTYQEMQAELVKMQQKYPHLISKPTAIEPFTTYNGNKIQWLRISNSPQTKQNKPQVLYTALHHAREPMSLSQMIFYMWYLLENYEKQSTVTNAINNTELYFIPCVNPDGYILNNQRNPTGGGMWRKNGFKNNAGELVGVDLNRNYGFFWGRDNEGSSPNPFAETYRGAAPFSEPETKAISSFVSANNFVLALNYHSHGNFLVHPWGHTEETNPDIKVFRNSGDILSNDNCFLRGTGQETVGYKTNGDADDWMYGDVVTKNRVFSFTPEVGSSFYPPKTDIIDIAKSVMDMNLKLPQLARNYAEIKPVSIPKNLVKASNRIGFVVNKVGFKNDPVKVSLKIDKGLTFSNLRESSHTLYISSGQGDTIYFNFKLDDHLKDGEDVNFTYTIAYDEVVRSETLKLNYFKESAQLAFGDDFENPNSTWKLQGSWGYTNVLKTSGSYSFTDSPSKLYASNTTSAAIMPGYLDLREYHKATIRYKTRWAIEKDFDYAQIMGSLDGTSWFPLCGKYSRVNNALQVVYDGVQEAWVEEEINIDEFIGASKFYIKFELVSDQLNNFDGIYIDEFKVDVVKRSTTSILELDKNITFSPNPSTGVVNLSDLVDEISISTLEGKNLYRVFDVNSLDIGYLKNGIYLMQIKVDNKVSTHKIIKI